MVLISLNSFWSFVCVLFLLFPSSLSQHQKYHKPPSLSPPSSGSHLNLIHILYFHTPIIKILMYSTNICMQPKIGQTT